MPDYPNKLSQFWQELKRRKVVRAITVYAAASFVILELTDIVAPSLGLPDWTLNFIIILLCVGFIITVTVSWIYDIHPEGGIVKTEPARKVKEASVLPSSKGWKIASSISFALIIALVLFHILSSGNSSSEILKLEKSIAVLPFENWSVGEEYSHLGNAIANEIITELSKVKDFHVISYTSSSRYSSSDKLSIPQIAVELGANFIIEGTVERQNEDVNIHVQVILAEHDDHIWADEFSGKWKDIFKIQDDIALEVADKLMAVLTPEEMVRIGEEPTENPEAYDYYLRGKSLYEANRSSLNQEAIYWFTESIKLDSSFSLPWTHLSMLYWRESSTSDSPEFQDARLAAERALELDPTSGTAIVNMAEILDNEYDFEGAEKKISSALEFEPDNPYVLRNAGRFYTLMSRQDMSISFCKRALLDDPTNPTALRYLLRAYFYAGLYTEAWTCFERIKQLGQMAHALTYYQLLLEEGKLERIMNEPSFQENNSAHNFGLASVYFKTGQKSVAENLCDNLKENNINNHNYIIALAHAYGDETEEAISWIERSFEAKERMLTLLGVDPGFKKLRNEPQVKSIMQEMKFPI